MPKIKRVMIFIDGSNLYHSLKESFGKTDINFELFRDKLCGQEREHIRTYYYNSPADQQADEEKYKSQQRFFEMLRKVPYFDVVLGRLQKKKGDRYVQKSVDIQLAIDMLSKAFRDQYDVAILVSGDADFVRVVEIVKDLGKHVELAFVTNQKCYHLTSVVDKTIEINADFLKDCWI